MRPIFCGNFEFDAHSGDLERLFRRHGKVDRVDMKSGFAFVYMEDERDAEYAIRALDRTEFGRKGRRLRVEWSKHERGERGDQGGDRGADRGDRGGRKSISSRRSANIKPSRTLFVINFPYDTTTRDLEKHFGPYGKIENVRIRRNFGFVQYESQEDATRALDATNMSKMLDRVISVEYSARDDADRKGGERSPDRRGRVRSPDRRRRSPSPYKRERGSPDYGTGTNPPAYRKERGSREYDRGSSRSPRRALRSSPKYDRRPRSPSPPLEERAIPSRQRDRSQSPREEGAIPDYRRDRSVSPREKRASPDYHRDRSRSPREEGAIPDNHRDRSVSPRGERNGNGYDRHGSRSPYKSGEASPIIEPGMKEDGEYESPVEDRYRSRSPVARERSQS